MGYRSSPWFCIWRVKIAPAVIGCFFIQSTSWKNIQKSGVSPRRGIAWRHCGWGTVCRWYSDGYFGRWLAQNQKHNITLFPYKQPYIVDTRVWIWVQKQAKTAKQKDETALNSKEINPSPAYKKQHKLQCSAREINKKASISFGRCS